MSPISAKTNALIDIHAVTMQGKKYGYVLQKASCWKARQWSAGLEKTPPMMGLGRISSTVTLTN